MKVQSGKNLGESAGEAHFATEEIEEQLSAEESKAAFYAEAEKRAAQFKKTGKGIPAEEVFDYLRNRIQGKPAIRPKARKLI